MKARELSKYILVRILYVCVLNVTIPDSTSRL